MHVTHLYKNLCNTHSTGQNLSLNINWFARKFFTLYTASLNRIDIIDFKMLTRCMCKSHMLRNVCIIDKAESFVYFIFDGASFTPP